MSFAPQDAMRLDVVLLSNYSGAAAAVLVALVLLVVADLRSDPRIAILAGGVGLVALRALESTAALLAAAPLLLLLMPAKPGRLRVAVPYGLLVVVGLALAARPLLPGQPGSYQIAGLGFDPHPGRLALRIAQLLGLHLSPLGRLVPAELLHPGVLVAVAALLAVWYRLGRESRGSEDTAGLGRLLAVGVVGAPLACAMLALSPANVTPWRTQILSAPFVGLALAGGIGGLARWRLGSALAPLLAAWVVAVGTSRVLAMQGEWDGVSYWPRQSECLKQLALAAPRFRPGTFLILLDERRAWPATFTFRHAVEYLYEGEAAGLVWGAEAFLYPARFTPAGLVSEPYASIREAWRAPAALHRFEDLVVARLDGSGSLRIEPEWPASLPPAPRRGRLLAAKGGSPAGCRGLGPTGSWGSIGDGDRILGRPRSRLPGVPSTARALPGGGVSCPSCGARYVEQDGLLDLRVGRAGAPGFDPHYFSFLAESDRRHFWFRRGGRWCARRFRGWSKIRSSIASSTWGAGAGGSWSSSPPRVSGWRERATPTWRACASCARG